MAEGRTGELQRGGVRVFRLAHVVPVEDVLAQRRVEAGGGRGQGHAREVRRRRVRVGVERGFPVARVPRPPAHGDLLRVHRVAHDEVRRGRLGRESGEQAHGQVKGSPPRVDRRGAAAAGARVIGQDQRGLGRRGEVVGDLAGVIGGVLVVFVPVGTCHGTSCGVGSISTGPPRSRTAASTSRVTAPAGTCGVSGMRRVWPPLCSTTASCCRRSRTTTREPERSGAGSGNVSQPRAVSRSAAVLELRLGRGQLHRQLAQQLGVGVQRVTGRLPLLVGQRGPGRRHARHAGLSLSRGNRPGRRWSAGTRSPPSATVRPQWSSSGDASVRQRDPTGPVSSLPPGHR